MAHKLYLDIETRWEPDLKQCGAVRCASDPTAGINCIAYAIDDGPVEVIKEVHCTKAHFYAMLGYHEPDLFIGHNSQFELEVLKRVLGVTIPVSKWRCTMAKAAYYGYPQGLDDAARALNLPKLKDIQGKEVMLKLVTGKYTPQTNPDDFNRLYSYCANDVAVTRMIDKALPDLPPTVQEQWELDAEINSRGVPVDVQAIRNACDLIAELNRLNDTKISCLTNGEVNSVNEVAKLKDWINKTCVIDLVDLTADTVEKALQYKNLPELIRLALQLRQEAGLSSLAKYKRMLDYQVDGRLYQMFGFYGTHTGRPIGRGPQVMNLPRGRDPEFWAGVLHEQPRFYLQVEKPSERLRESLRGVIRASNGYTFVGMDLAQIEARATGWVAGDKSFLDLFTTSDPYCTYGKKLFGKEITKKNDPEERNAAKAAVLAFGFAGGIGAGQRIGINYNMDYSVMSDIILPSATPLELAEAERNYTYYYDKKPLKPLSQREGHAVDILKQRYRKDFPRIAAYWDELEQAFLLGGNAGKISVSVSASNLRTLTLPSGRQLFYHNVQVDDKGQYSYQGSKGREILWKGVLIENVAQAVNADISDWYKIQANKIAPVVHHCYDEFTMECRSDDAERVLENLKALTATKPHWCQDLPLGFDYWTGRRYGK